MNKNLDLYAKIEPYIGFYSEYEKLYNIYLKILQKYNVKTILDVGCGNGKMLEKLCKNGYDAEGIDISPKMVQIALDRGVRAVCKDIGEVKDSYDAIIAVADVLNYMPKKQLKMFLAYVKSSLKENAIFICDINTFYGFSEVADGAMIKDENDIFLSVDAFFDGKVLNTNIVFFEKVRDLYKKNIANISQYYHKIEDVKCLTPMELMDINKVSLFGDKADKVLLCFKNKEIV